MSLLTDGKLAKTIANALANVMYPIIIKRTVAGAYNPATGSVSTSTTTYTARGTIDSFSAAEIQAGIVQPGDRRVTLLTQGLPITPSPATDTAIIDGGELVVLRVSGDPAGATWILQCR